MSPIFHTALALALQAAPTVQRPSASPTTSATTTSATTTPATTPATTTPATTPATTTSPEPTSAPAEPTLAPSVTPVQPVPQDSTPALASPEPGPPFYQPADMEAMRLRYGLEPSPPTIERKPVFRCLIADPTCGFVVELNATSAYAFRARQGNVNGGDLDVNKWSSTRVQYDVWFSIPTMVETRGKFRYTRLSLGPKGGVIASDSKDLWGNVGIAGRYWFSRKRFAPNLEFTSALVFKVAGQDKAYNRFDNARGPIGFSADIGFGIGGFGSIVVGGQYDSPLAREDVSDIDRVSAGGMFFIGFRGNILWGAPAALAVATHAITTRSIHAP